MSKKTTVKTKSMGANSKEDLQEQEPQSDDDLRAAEPEGSLAWSVLSPSDTRHIMRMTAREMAERVAVVLSLTDHDCSMQQAAELDCYVAALWFARENGFGVRQIAMFFSIFSQLVRNYKERRLSLKENVHELKQMMGPDSSGFSQFDVFDAHQQQLVVKYITETVFEHSKLFIYLFSYDQPELIQSSSLVIDIPALPGQIFPHPLEDAISEEMWHEHVCPPDKKDQVIDNQSANTEEKENIKVEVNPLDQLSPEQVRKVVDEVSGKVLGKFESNVKQQLNERELTYVTRLERLEKMTS